MITSAGGDHGTLLGSDCVGLGAVRCIRFAVLRIPLHQHRVAYVHGIDFNVGFVVCVGLNGVLDHSITRYHCGTILHKMGFEVVSPS